MDNTYTKTKSKNGVLSCIGHMFSPLFLFIIFGLCYATASPRPTHIKTYVNFTTVQIYENWLKKQSAKKNLVLVFSFIPTPKHLDQLIDQHIIEMRFDQRTHDKQKSSVFTEQHCQSIQKRAPSLKRLKFFNIPLTDDNIRALSDLKKLSVLGLRKAQITNYGMRLISRQFSKLRILDVSETQINGQGLSTLIHLKYLKELNIVGIPLKIFHIGHITAIPALQKLHLHRQDDQRYKKIIQKLHPTLQIMLDSNDTLTTSKCKILGHKLASY